MNLLQMSFCGAVMILAVALIRAVAINRLPKRTFLVLWGIIMIRLLVPLEVPSEFSVYSLAGRGSVKELVDAPVRENGWLAAWDALGTQGEMEWRVETDSGKSGQQPAASKPEDSGQYLTEIGNGTDARQSALADYKVIGQGEAVEGIVRVEQQDVLGIGWAATFLHGMGRVLGVNVLSMIWGVGVLVCAAYFITTYVRCRREFSMSLPVENEFVAQWMERRLSEGHRFFHGFCHKAGVRVSDRVDTPLTYGVFCPVILLPKKLEWEGNEQLEYILWHEYMHIYHCDNVMKLLAVFVCCIHWFNPLAWLMYVLLNRDVELACDESVVRRKGVNGKAVYANILIDMEAERNRISPLCSNLSLNAIEKRIRAIMRIRKFSIGAVAIAAGLVMSVTVVFATSAVPEAEKDIASNADFAAEEYEMLNALRFDGYEDMSVSEFRDKALETISTDEYRELLNRFFMDKGLYEMRGRDETASFLFYALRPLTAQWWRETYFYGNILPEDMVLPQKEVQGLGYGINIYVLNASDLSVGEYVDTICGVAEGLSQTMAKRSEEELAAEAYMETEIQRAVELLQKEWSTYKLKVGIEFEYESINWQEEERPEKEVKTWKNRYSDGRMHYAITARENSEYQPGTEEDYRKILLLRQPGYRYKEMSVADFDRILFDWSVENYQSYNRIINDIFLDDFQVELSEDEKYFITHTINVAAQSNRVQGDLQNFESLERGISFALCFNKKSPGDQVAYVWDNVDCYVSYVVTDKDSVTVGERDQCVGGMMDAVERLWKGMDAGAALEMKRGDFHSRVVNLAKEYSSKDITVSSLCSNYFLGWWMA